MQRLPCASSNPCPAPPRSQHLFRRGAGIALATLVFLAGRGYGQTAPVPGQNINMRATIEKLK